jgi:chromosome segregation ATPase
VRFRAGQELQELSKGTQSGGEKSVTTAVYMMALQELTQVPFRCVDEINQGMDEQNERAVWDQLLKVCRQHKAQYFYMAPKFPYSLPFDEQVGQRFYRGKKVFLPFDAGDDDDLQ